MPFHGFLAQAELLRDVAIAAALDDASDDLHLARRQTECFAFRRGSLLHELVQCADEIDDAPSADPVIAGVDGANGAGEVIGESILEHDAASADLQRFNDLLRGDGAGEQDDFYGRRPAHDGAHGFETRQARHGEIEQQNVGQQLEGLRDGLVAVSGLTYDREGFISLQHVTHANPDDGVVVGEQYPDRWSRCLLSFRSRAFWLLGWGRHYHSLLNSIRCN